MSKPLLNSEKLNQGMLEFLQASPTPFHATANMAQQLSAAGFERLDEGAAWELIAGKRYFVTRNDSSIIAFVYGKQPLLDTGIRMVGAHTDSPCLKIKPRPELMRLGYAQLGVEVYGGALLAPWFDRDLSCAGRVTYRDRAGDLRSVLVDFKRAIATIPSLAIHLDRGVNENRSINAQKDIVPVFLQLGAEECPLPEHLPEDQLDEYQSQGSLRQAPLPQKLLPQECLPPEFRSLLAAQIRAQYPEKDVADVLDYEISLYDTQLPARIGLQGDFIASARLDNLLSCYVGLQAILEADTNVSSLLICTDHEEVGSASCCGAKGPMLQQFLERLLPQIDERVRIIDRSLMISADNAHGVHPNFMDRHDENHGPLLNRGPVIKVNANQRYATTSETSATFRLLCERAGVPVQSFVARTDMGCGSTIGPVVASEVGVKTLDVGVPMFAMHSIRELAGSQDAWYLYAALAEFCRYNRAPGNLTR
jgi:aspartyl aminopeptidase